MDHVDSAPAAPTIFPLSSFFFLKSIFKQLASSDTQKITKSEKIFFDQKNKINDSSCENYTVYIYALII